MSYYTNGGLPMPKSKKPRKAKPMNKVKKDDFVGINKGYLEDFLGQMQEGIQIVETHLNQIAQCNCGDNPDGSLSKETMEQISPIYCTIEKDIEKYKGVAEKLKVEIEEFNGEDITRGIDILDKLRHNLVEMEVVFTPNINEMTTIIVKSLESKE
jgi:hypothetical protein